MDLSCLIKRDQVWGIACTTAATALALYGVYYATIKKDALPEGLKEIPTPKGGLPYFGHIFSVDEELPGLKFDEWNQKYGPIFRINMGLKTWVIISDRHIAHDLLANKGAATAERPFHLFMIKYYALDGRGMTFTSPDQRWKRSRTAAQTVLSSKGVARLSSYIESEADHVVEQLLEGSSKNGSVNMVEHAQLMSLNIILRLCFGIRTKSVDDPLFKSLVYTINTTVKLGAPGADLGTFLPAFSKIIDIAFRKEDQMIDFTYNCRNPLFRQLIQEALDKDTDCLAKYLYSIKGENEFEDDDILLFLADMVNAGVETTSSTFSWGMVILCHHKGLQERLHREIDSFIIKHKRLPVYDERENFPLLLSVQKECLRYKPTNHLVIPHETTEDLVYKNYFIPKGTTLISNTYSLCRDPNTYDNPDEFKPERFLEDLRPLSISIKAPADKRENYMFGWGRRQCPGAHLAEVELFNVWVRVLATMMIGPELDKNGQPLYPDLNALRDTGINVVPLKSQIRFIERPDRIV